MGEVVDAIGLRPRPTTNRRGRLLRRAGTGIQVAQDGHLGVCVSRQECRSREVRPRLRRAQWCWAPSRSRQQPRQRSRPGLQSRPRAVCGAQENDAQVCLRGKLGMCRFRAPGRATPRRCRREVGRRHQDRGWACRGCGVTCCLRRFFDTEGSTARSPRDREGVRHRGPTHTGDSSYRTRDRRSTGGVLPADQRHGIGSGGLVRTRSTCWCAVA
jgi:hypothetical protein